MSRRSTFKKRIFHETYTTLKEEERPSREPKRVKTVVFYDSGRTEVCDRFNPENNSDDFLFSLPTAESTTCDVAECEIVGEEVEFPSELFVCNEDVVARTSFLDGDGNEVVQSSLLAEGVGLPIPERVFIKQECGDAEEVTDDQANELPPQLADFEFTPHFLSSGEHFYDGSDQDLSYQGDNDGADPAVSADHETISVLRSSKLDGPSSSDRLRRKRNQCPICGEIFMVTDEVKWHFDKFHALTVLKMVKGPWVSGCQPTCRLCNREFQSGSMLFLHWKDKHKNHQLYSSDIFLPGDEQFVIESSRQEDQYNHYCVVCDRTYANLVLLDKHVQLSHGGVISGDLVQCLACHTTVCWQTFGQHKEDCKDMTPSRVLKETCLECAQMFPTHELLQLHVRTAHKARPDPLRCPTCNRTFLSESNRDRHASLCSRLSKLEEKQEAEKQARVEVNSTCQFCGKKMKDKNALAGHMQRMHPEATSEFL